MTDTYSLRQQLSTLVDQITQHVERIESSMFASREMNETFRLLFSKRFKFET